MHGGARNPRFVFSALLLICAGAAWPAHAASLIGSKGSARGQHRHRHQHRLRTGVGSMRHGRAGSTKTLRLVWSDDFNGPAGGPPDPTRWQAVSGGNGWGNNELEYYTSRTANVSLDGAGHLAIIARRETYAGADGVTRNYTSARIQTKGLFQTRYGTIEARIRLPVGKGLWPAFWMLGSNIDAVSWPACGEIDVMENIGSDPFTAHGTIHGPDDSTGAAYGLGAPVSSHTSLAGGFHVYGITWSAKAISFSLDGVTYETRTPSSLSGGQQWVFNQPFYLLLNLAVGGTMPGSPNGSTQFPASLLVDWVRVYN
jgi:beta-glucanase (GH16 family)